jgi:hypothetical protein
LHGVYAQDAGNVTIYNSTLYGGVYVADNIKLEVSNSDFKKYGVVAIRANATIYNTTFSIATSDDFIGNSLVFSQGHPNIEPGASVWGALPVAVEIRDCTFLVSHDGVVESRSGNDCHKLVVGHGADVYVFNSKFKGKDGYLMVGADLCNSPWSPRSNAICL